MKIACLFSWRFLLLPHKKNNSRNENRKYFNFHCLVTLHRFHDRHDCGTIHHSAMVLALHPISIDVFGTGHAVDVIQVWISSFFIDESKGQSNQVWPLFVGESFHLMKSLWTITLLALGLSLHAQQLYLEGFGTFNSTKYDAPSSDNYLNDVKKYLGYGGRLAFGADHVQVGGEYRSNISNPSFTDKLGATLEFDETYYGGFLRTKISRYPAMRFGLVLRAGAGVYNTTVVRKLGAGSTSQDYDAILGFNGGVGFSIPVLSHTMLELGYTYNYLERGNEVFAIAEHTASYHVISAGLSLNFVFGERAKQYQHLKENWKFRNGWRG